MANVEQGKINKSHEVIMQQLSEEIGAKLFPGDEHILNNMDVLGIVAGTHRLFRAHTQDGGTYPMIVSVDQKISGEFFI